MNWIIQMKEYLGILHISVILSDCKHSYKIYYAFKNKSKWTIGIKKEKDIISVNDKICM